MSSAKLRLGILLKRKNRFLLFLFKQYVIVQYTFRQLLKKIKKQIFLNNICLTSILQIPFVVHIEEFASLFIEQPLMNRCCNQPNRKACAKHNPEGKLTAKACKGNEEKQNARQNAPQSTLGVIGHQIEIAGIIQIQPDEHDKAGQGHHSNQTCQCWQLLLLDYPATQRYYTKTDYNLDD